MIRRLAVYCGACDGRDSRYQKAAHYLGLNMAKHQIELVYGGGQYGLMGAVAQGVLDGHGVVHGVITKQLAGRGVTMKTVTDLHLVDDMDTRKETMMKLADGMLALPGGLGTLEEVSQAASWMTLGDNEKPVAFYNLNDFYAPLKGLLGEMNKAGFLEQRYLNSLCFSADFKEILHFMNSYQAPLRRRYKDEK
ncbi:MAG: TIGR00730 family Rossman fold protein [Lactobacillaceae bacterium]|uniref:LOG family protein n=1 Tax=Limosilactobacillus sp. TaxID=2773925 RepID=UPI002A765644|nr:TIGR00730 family Rossman fold protein [Limosilactobacillus sp.]MDD7693062.1 TIGR00730 family Rossman fold protein [Lactobacillaceae bacterium]MDY2803417.1 TIGR00730 family Rossman fold protein [Limosilactobacillus sp.]